MGSYLNIDIITRLENNLRSLSDAINFVDQLTEEDLMPLNGEGPLLNSLTDEVRYILTAYLESKKDITDLRKIIREYIETKRPEAKGNLLIPYGMKLFEFNDEADREVAGIV